jgi:hypothetical protein
MTPAKSKRLHTKAARLMRQKPKTDPFPIAHKLVSKNVDVSYLLNIAQGITRDRVYDQLLRAVDPRIDKYDRLERRYTKQSKGTGAEDLVYKLSDNWCDKAVIWMDAAFTVGLALGTRFAGGKRKAGRHG